MRLIPVTRNSAVTLLLAGALPLVPLTAKIPLQTILKMLLKVAA